MTSSVKLSIRPEGQIEGTLELPSQAQGLVLFAHGSGSSRLSPRNQRVAKELQNKNYATLLFDLLTEGEESNREKVFDCELLATRLMEVALWVEQQPYLKVLPLALFGASTGSAAAVIAAAHWPQRFQALISRGGRPDLAREFLKKIKAPTLLIVGQKDELVLRLNRLAFEELNCKKALEIVPGATHLFEEPGKLEEVAKLSLGWLDENVKAPPLPFENRKTAGEKLAKRMRGRVFTKPLVVAIPRGGVITGFSLAKELGAELGLIQARKLKHPFSPEWAIGAVCEDQEPLLTEEGLRLKQEDPKLLKEEIQRERKEIEKRNRKFMGFSAQGKVKARTVILTDDGIATGSTVIAAAKCLRDQKPKELIIAVPLAPRDSLEKLKEIADELVCLASPAPFFSVGEFYREFPQVEDGEMMQWLSPVSGKKFIKK